MADNKAELVLDGDVSPLRQKLREAARDLQQFGDEGKSSLERMGGPLKALQDKFIAIGAVLAGGAVFKAAVDEAARFTQESIELGRALDVSATEAGNLKLALDDNETSQQEFVTAAKGLLKQVRENESGLNAMGLATRDAAGNMRPMNEMTLDAIGVLNSYRAGTDRAIAAQVMFGKGFEMTSNLAKINAAAVEETTAFAKSLGLQVGEDNVQAWNAWDDAMDKTHLVMQAVKNTIGTALMPVLAKLGEWFASIGPSAITVVRGAIGGLIAAFWALKNGATVVFAALNAMVVTVAEPLRALYVAVSRALVGDFSGAAAAFSGVADTIKGSWQAALKDMEASSTESWEKIKALFVSGGPAAAEGQGGKSAAGLVKKDKTGKPFDEEGFFQEMMAKANAEAEKEIQIARKRTQQLLQIRQLQLEGEKNAELARIAELEAQSQHEVEMGLKTQAEHLADLEHFNQQRLAVEQTFQDQKRALELQDPDKNPVELERIEQEKLEIRRRYAAQAADIQRQQALESQSIWRSFTDSISGLWDKGVQALMNGTLTWRNATRAIGAEMVRWFAVEVVGAMVKRWVAGHAAKFAASMGWKGMQSALDKVAAAETVATKASETTAVVGMNAAQAGAGAAASQAPIPIVGPMLALAAMAAVFAAVSALGNKRKSAMGGYDIPKGLNPVTQLHEEEMVLPKQYANAIRSMTKNGGAGEGGDGGGGGPLIGSLHISALDGRSVRDVLMNNPDAIAAAIKNAHRNGYR